MIKDPDALLGRAKQLVSQLEDGSVTEVDRLIEEITSLRETSLFNELGRLTRDLHEALKAFQFDQRFGELTSTEIPDACKRLSYVVNVTEEAAHKTLNAVEESIPVASSLRDEARALAAKEFGPDVPKELVEFVTRAATDGGLLSTKLTEVMMAQEYQDLTGQIIRKVIDLVDEVEKNLVDLIKLSKTRLQPDAVEPDKLEVGGPFVPGVDKGEVVTGQDEVDELLSSLGF